MSDIKTVSLSSIDRNPHRLLAEYPFNPAKLKALQHSIEDVGMWEGVIVRPVGKRYQAAFGHHRLEAARLAGLKRVPVIVKELGDEDMLKYMGRENGEDYQSEFTILLETWEAGVKHIGDDRPQKSQDVDIARVLGWTEFHKDGRERMTPTAKACAAAADLIYQGHIKRRELNGLAVFAAREIMTRARQRIKTIHEAGAKTNRPKEEIDRAKRHVAKGATITVRDAKEGRVAQKDLRSEVDVNAYKAAATSKVKESPLFDEFGKALADSINKMLSRDATAGRLEEVSKALGMITMEADFATLRQLQFELSEVANRAKAWEKRLVPTSQKVVGLPALEKKDA